MPDSLLSDDPASIAIPRLRMVGADLAAERSAVLPGVIAPLEHHGTEAQLRQARKMEALGQLTGGIAHDFSNMLNVVVGNLSLMKRRLDRGETDVARYADAAMDGADRAAALTRRLLAFSRQQPALQEPIDVNELVDQMAELLSRTLGGDIRIETILAPGLWRVGADPSQLENVILNLAINARDAMSGGGHLTIETANAEKVASEGGVTGGCVRLTVTDDGIGMSPDVAGRAFEPFFTTKPAGQGTGLGLSQVFGFARQLGGHARIRSASGRGTTIELGLPRYAGDAVHVATALAGPSEMPVGTRDEIILVVEDDERVRAFAVEALTVLGYGILAAASAEVALILVETEPSVTLLFTDIVLPGMSGRRLAGVLAARSLGLKLLFTTGHTHDIDALDDDAGLLRKPFDLRRLAFAVRAAIDR